MVNIIILIRELDKAITSGLDKIEELNIILEKLEILVEMEEDNSTYKAYLVKTLDLINEYEIQTSKAARLKQELLNNI